ncbi:hypothetical protein O5D80_000889 [Batrachochytrium dendrobatidis]|nr:hypothetical protein O5D80_000889 [Batrachochytrium dendrobatidis]
MLVYVHTCTTTTINSSTYKRYAAVAIRWTSATLYWVIMTQWAFGNPLLDRVYLSTGHCLTMTNTVEVRSIRQCKSLGGSLTGLDISGHCFLLVHAILTTFEELKPYFKLHTLDSSSALMAHFTSLSKMCLSILSLVLITLGLIWWIMLFTTSLYFHSFIEASSGTLLGMLHWLVLYVVTGSLYPNVLPFDVSLVSQPNKSQKHL